MPGKISVFAAVVVTLLVWASESRAEELLREFHGSGSTITPVFDVEGPWLLDWRVNGDYELLMAIDIVLLDGRSGLQIGRIIHTKRRGNGVKLFNSSGSYKLRVDATLTQWDLKVIKITAAEAELYTPRKQK